jgi:hypothetical protein
VIGTRDPWTRERRRQLSAIHRKRWGAPEGYCTIRGIHVPFEHREPIRYWSDWWAHHYGEDDAKKFVADLKSADWKLIPRLRQLWNQKRQVGRNRDLIRNLVWEAYHREHQNGR